MAPTLEQRQIWKHFRQNVLQPAPMREMSDKGTINNWIMLDQLAQKLDPLFDEPEQKKKPATPKSK